MEDQYHALIVEIYNNFNQRNIPEILKHMKADVLWPNGWEGGFVKGHDEVAAYWTRQWKEIDPQVDPVTVETLEPGKIEVQVHQVVKDFTGKVLFDGMVKHVYTFRDDLIQTMEIA